MLSPHVLRPGNHVGHPCTIWLRSSRPRTLRPWTLGILTSSSSCSTWRRLLRGLFSKLHPAGSGQLRQRTRWRHEKRLVRKALHMLSYEPRFGTSPDLWLGNVTWSMRFRAEDAWATSSSLWRRPTFDILPRPFSPFQWISWWILFGGMFLEKKCVPFGSARWETDSW